MPIVQKIENLADNEIIQASKTEVWEQQLGQSCLTLV